MGKIDISQMPIIAKPHALHHNPFKMTHHVIGQKKCAAFQIHCRIKISFAYKAVIVMRARDSRDIFLNKEHIKLTASATITIDHNRVGTSFTGGFDLYLYAEDNFLRVVVPCCWQA